MDIKLLIFYSVIFLFGYMLLIFNKEVGDFAAKNLETCLGRLSENILFGFHGLMRS